MSKLCTLLCLILYLSPILRAEDSNAINSPQTLVALSLADWINTGQVQEFLGKTPKMLHDDRVCYSRFNAFENLNVWMAPLYFHSHFATKCKKGEEIDFQLNTVGIGSGGSVTFPSHITVGGALGYYHTHLSYAESGRADANSIYLGFYGAFWLPNGYLSATLFGAANIYDGKLLVKREEEVIKKKPKWVEKKIDTNTHSWDLVTRVSGGYHYELPDNIVSNSSLHPFFSVEYTGAFISSFKEVRGWNASYLKSHMGTKLSKTILCTPEYIIVPKLSLGWIFRLPIDRNLIEVEGQPKRAFNVAAKNQLALGLEVAGIKADGILVSLDYTSYIGASAPLQAIHLRIEWSW